MTSKERVLRAIEFRGPDRVPFASGVPITSDITMMFFSPARDWQPDEGYFPNIHPLIYRLSNWRYKKYLPLDVQSSGYERQDEFGCIWKTVIENSVGDVIGHPLKSIDDFDKITLPDPNAPGRFAASAALSKVLSGNTFVLGIMECGLWERMHFLRDFSDILMDIATEPEKVGAFADRLVEEWFLPLIKRFAKHGCDGVILTDDWGTQNGPMISPKSWDQIFKPRYKRLFDTAHDLGMKFFMHSCGHIKMLIPGLIDAGLDVLQKDDVCFMGLDELAEEFSGKICFMGSLDIQRTLPDADDATISEETKRMIHALGSNDGGVIGMYYSQPAAAGFSWRKQFLMRAAFLRHGRYPLR